MKDNYYQLLGVSRDANAREIDNAHELKRRDHGRDPDHLDKLDEAWRVLSNPFERGRYDRQLSKSDPVTDYRGQENPKPSSSPINPALEDRPRTEVIQIERSEPPGSTPSMPRGRTEVIDVSSYDVESLSSEKESEKKPGADVRAKTEVISIDTHGKARAAREPTEVFRTDDMVDDSFYDLEDASFVEEYVQKEFSGSSSDIGQTIHETNDTVSSNRGLDSTARTRYEIEVSFRGTSQHFRLKDGRNLVGRPNKKNMNPDIPIPDKTKHVSREHAYITCKDNQITIQDNSSVNGTFLNGQLLRPHYEHPIKHSDVISIEERELRLILSEF